MTLAQLRALVAVVESGSFSRAADLLRVTQSGVSHAVATLEKELAAPLFERVRGTLALTECGQRVLVHAREMLEREENIRREVKLVGGAETGRVRLGSVPSVSARVLPRLLAFLARRHPGLDVVLFEGSDDEVREWLLSSAIDVGVVTLPSKTFQTTEFTTDQMVAVVPNGHRIAAKPKVRLREIASTPFIMSKGGCEPLIRGMFRSANVPLRVRYEVRDMATILGMVKEGLGVTIVPTLTLPEVHPGIRALPVYPPLERRLALAVRPREASPPAVRAFIREAQSFASRQ
jgi:DNA-binding transcriptional LysR family regulator